MPIDVESPPNDVRLTEPEFVFQPSAWKDSLKNPEDLLGLSTTVLSERLQIFTEAFTNRIKDTLQLKLNKDFGTKVAKFLRQNQEKESVWPLKFPLSASDLIAEQGLLAVFVFRNSEKSGILEAIDLSYFNKGVLTRNYWSRRMSDPQLRETAPKALNKVTVAFKKQLKAIPMATEGNIRFAFDKTVSDIDFAALELLLKSKGQNSVFDAYEINKKDIRYKSTLAKSSLDTVISKIKKSGIKIDARPIPGDDPLVQISNKIAQ